MVQVENYEVVKNVVTKRKTKNLHCFTKGFEFKGTFLPKRAPLYLKGTDEGQINARDFHKTSFCNKFSFL